jgi:CRP-like cAMP-binding protein
MSLGRVFHRRGERLHTVYFPDGGVTSITSTMRDGRTIEVATVGSEGLVGLPVFWGGDVALCDATVVVSGNQVHGLPAETFRAEIARRGPLYELVSRYTVAFLELVMQTAACNSLHPVEARCCRWILLTHDRVARDEFALTHDALAVMLGVRRPTVSVVLRDLERGGLLRPARGRIAVANRRGLEAAACECYRAIRAQFDALPAIGPAAGAAR